MRKLPLKVFKAASPQKEMFHELFMVVVWLLVVFTPEDEQLEPENDGLVQMIFLFQGAHILRFQMWASSRVPYFPNKKTRLQICPQKTFSETSRHQ